MSLIPHPLATTTAETALMSLIPHPLATATAETPAISPGHPLATTETSVAVGTLGVAPCVIHILLSL